MVVLANQKEAQATNVSYLEIIDWVRYLKDHAYRAYL